MYIIELLSEMVYKVYESSRCQPARLYDERTVTHKDLHGQEYLEMVDRTEIIWHNRYMSKYSYDISGSNETIRYHREQNTF